MLSHAGVRLADTSNMPIILNETDVEGDDDNRQHRKRWSWDDSKNLYDRMVGDSKGIKSQDNQTRTGRFRGALWVIQTLLCPPFTLRTYLRGH